MRKVPRGFEVVGVVADRAGILALDFAKEHGIPTATVLPKSFASRPLWDAALADACAEFAPDLIVLAGFMRILGPATVARFRARIINVHPSLLPAFPGVDGPAQAIAARVAVSGCTVHIVGRGPRFGGRSSRRPRCPCWKATPPRPSTARIQSEEHRLLPAVVGALARGELRLEPARA
jgi:phosphoribosylglycinamide formyltransferase-1